jgi:hypothetical protein
MLLRMDKFKGERRNALEIDPLLRSGSAGDRLAAVERLKRLTDQVQPLLPDHWAKQARVAGLRLGLLTLVIDDRAFLLEARYLNDELLRQLQQRPDFRDLKRIKWELSRMTAEDAKKAHHAERIQTPPPLEIEEFLSLALERANQKSSDG